MADSLEERIAERLHEALGRDDWGVANDDERDEMLDLARAVVAVLPTADVSDEDIEDCGRIVDVPSVRALLDAQAAAHAAEVEALRAEAERLTSVIDAGNDVRRAYMKRADTAEADRDELRERLDAVRALIEEPFTAADIRAALDGGGD